MPAEDASPTSGYLSPYPEPHAAATEICPKNDTPPPSPGATIAAEVADLKRQLARLAATVESVRHIPADVAEIRATVRLLTGQSPSAYRSPSDAADILGVTQQTLADWEREGLLPERSVAVTPKGHRRYHVLRIAADMERRARDYAATAK